MQYGPKIVTDSLVLALDAADNNSAPHNDLPVKQGCVTWLDGADDDVFSYSSGTLVSQWRDKSGNDNHVSQSTTSSQPTRNRTLNSKSVVDFDGSDDSLSSSNSLTLSSGHTMFAVTLTDAFSSDAGLISIQDRLDNGITIHTGGYAYFYFGSGSYNTTQSVAASTSYILSKVWTGATSGNRISYKDGTQGYSTGTMASSHSTGVLRLGQQTTYYNGYIAEVIIYNRELSQDEITKVHNYLQNKWNISVSDAKWYDQTANAYNGTPANGPTYSETNKGYFDFDGTNDQIAIGNLGSFSTFTVEVLFKSDSVTNYKNVMDCNWLTDNATYSNSGPRLEQYTSGSLAWVIGPGDGTYYGITIGSISSSQWVHAVITKTGTSSFVGYLNIPGTNASQNGSFTGWYGSLDDVVVGKGFNNSRYYDGKIALVRIYNKALSSDEVLQNYNAVKARFT